MSAEFSADRGAARLTRIAPGSPPCGARIHEYGCDLLLFVNSARLSSGDLILVREAAEDLLSADPVLGEVDLRWPGMSLSRWQLA